MRASCIIAAGPNNPAGSVWIALDQKTYGIHGTAEPFRAGKVDSRPRAADQSGCAGGRQLVRKGMPVAFID